MSGSAQRSALRVGLAQYRPEVGAPEAQLAQIDAVLTAEPSADLMVWPELYLSGYTTTQAAEQAEALDGERVTRLRALARRHDTALVIGLCEKHAGGTANSALAIDRDGRIAGCYRKTQLFGDEARAFRAGDVLNTVSLCGVRVGLMICFDIEFPEIARSLALDGAELLVSISANMTPFGPDHRLCVQARALENRLAHVYVNQVGQGQRFLFTGESAVADDAGKIVNAHDGRSEGCCLVDVSLAVETTTRPNYLALRRGALAVVRDHTP